MNADDGYRRTIRELSDRLVEAQRPIRILDAIKWDRAVQARFFESGCRDQPAVDRGYYESRPLPFDTGAKRREFQEIERDINRRLGRFNPIGVIMRRMCTEYETVVRMLEARGTPEFSLLSQELYGSAGDVFYANDPTLADLGVMMSEALSNIDASLALREDEKTITAPEAVERLRDRLGDMFADPEHGVRIMLNDGIVADAAAGSRYLKIRSDARFSERDLRLLEIHEGWVHLGTTYNGLQQPVCTFLSKGPPSATATQEGLALLTELMALASHPARLKRVTNRVQAVNMAEHGASFVDVFNYFRDGGFQDADAYSNSARVFRGSTPTGGPFTKDLVYSKGFVLVYNYMRIAVRKGMLDRIPLLFCGKTTLEDLRTLAQAVEEGVVLAPVYLPPLMSDLNAVASWMCYSNFLNRLDLRRIEADYWNIL